MFFHKSADINGILELIKPKLTCILSNCKWGIDVTITEFIAYLDGIQQLMIEQTQGHYDPIYPEERFQTFN